MRRLILNPQNARRSHASQRIRGNLEDSSFPSNEEPKVQARRCQLQPDDLAWTWRIPAIDRAGGSAALPCQRNNFQWIQFSDCAIPFILSFRLDLLQRGWLLVDSLSPAAASRSTCDPVRTPFLHFSIGRQLVLFSFNGLMKNMGTIDTLVPGHSSFDRTHVKAPTNG